MNADTAAGFRGFAVLSALGALIWAVILLVQGKWDWGIAVVVIFAAWCWLHARRYDSKEK